MKKIKDFSKVIGIVERGGVFSASNEKSWEKIRHVFFEVKATSDFREACMLDMEKLKEVAARVGFEVKIISRGLNR